MAGLPCPRCSTVSPPGTRTCPSCGTSLINSEKNAKLRAGVTPSMRGDENVADVKTRERAPVSGKRPAVRDSLIGQKLQEYVVEEKIGSGGMGNVYRAVHPMIGKHVAVKVLRGDLVTDARDMERLLDEARVVSSIKHRGIINIFGAGTLEDGRHYLIMELLEGEALDDLLAREGTVSAADTAIILEQVLSALAAAHAAGVVHRDLKPANVFLVKEGNARYVKLLDFGLARRKQEEVTRIAGTPDYISPEHARGRPAGPPADLYAFGVLCFHMLTGKLPFTGITPMDVMEQHVHTPPPVPHEVNPDIPRPLSELILRLLEKEPGARPSAQQVKADLRAATNGLRSAATMMSLQAIEPVGNEPPPPKGREKVLARQAQVAGLKRTASRNRPLLIAGAVALWLAGVLVYVNLPSSPPDAPPPPLKAVKPVPKPAPVAVDLPKPVVPPTPAPTVADDPAPLDSHPAPPMAAATDAGDEDGRQDIDAELDDVYLGQWKRDKVEERLSVMKATIEAEPSKRDYFELKLKKVALLCERANTIRTLNDCEDEVMTLNNNFYK
ncbi:MAG: protein kinase [Archangium sp.]|nr:protein kinase [Archangium sp.]